MIEGLPSKCETEAQFLGRRREGELSTGQIGLNKNKRKNKTTKKSFPIGRITIGITNREKDRTGIC